MRVVSKGIVVLGAMLLALAPAVAGAQENKVHINFGGGPTFVAGNLGDHFSTGWGPAIGVTLDGKKNLGFQFEYAYRWFSVGDGVIPPGATQFSANHQTHQLDFNLVMNLTKPDSGMRGYVVAGPGAYYRKVEITKYEGTGVICDPYWYVCGAYPISSIVGSRGGWDFGFDLGGGVGFKIGGSSEFYVESRFHYVAGPEIPPVALPVGTTNPGGSSTGYYWPLTFGFRF
jgi:opacity protein-like surface antigen